MTAPEYNSLIHELAHESVKRSLLSDHYTDVQCDGMADELVHTLRRTIDNWTEHRIQAGEKASGVSWNKN